MFRGRSKHTLDEKGRLVIPSRFKEVINARGDRCLILTNYGDCLWAFTRNDWHELEQKVIKLPLFDENLKVYRRYFISGAAECPIKGGRITIPVELRQSAGLIKDVVLVGALNFFEIWDSERWEEVYKESEKSFPEVAKALSGLGL